MWIEASADPTAESKIKQGIATLSRRNRVEPPMLARRIVAGTGNGWTEEDKTRIPTSER